MPTNNILIRVIPISIQYIIKVIIVIVFFIRLKQIIQNHSDSNKNQKTYYATYGISATIFCGFMHIIRLRKNIAAETLYGIKQQH